MRLSTAVLAGLVVLASALAFKAFQLAKESSEEARAARVRIGETERINQGLIDRIHSLRPPPFSLRGKEATTGQDIGVEAVGSMVIYLFHSSCPFSPESVPFLNQLHASGVPVIGLAPDEFRPFIAGFARMQGATFPLLADPSGDVVDILPTGSVPLTAVFLGGRLEHLWLGPLEEYQREVLADQFEI